MKIKLEFMTGNESDLKNPAETAAPVKETVTADAEPARKSAKNNKKTVQETAQTVKKAACAAGRGAKKTGEALLKLTRKASKTVNAVCEEINEDVAAVRERDPAAKSDVEVLLLYSGLHAILAYRVAHKLYLGKKFFSARAVSQFAKFCTGIEIHPGATIGHGLFIDHGAGVVIGETCEIGDHCTLYQGVTLGGTGKDVGKRHPTLGDNVMIGAGAKVLGPFRIGDNTKIAAGAVVLKEIPDNSTAVGIPARVVRRDGVKVGANGDALDQVHVPDPVAQQLSELEAKIGALGREIEKLNAEKEKNAEKDQSGTETAD